MLKAVIFDLDGTLYDYEACHHEAMRSLAEGVCMKYQITENQFLPLFDRARKDVKGRLGNVAAAHNRLLYIQGALEQLNRFRARDALELYQEVFPLMQWLKGLGIKIAVCTDLTARIQFEKIVESGLDDYIDVIVTSEEVGAEKPDERMFGLALDKLGAGQEEAIMFGDNDKRDIQGANRLFIQSVWMDPRNHQKSYEQLRQAVLWKMRLVPPCVNTPGGTRRGNT